MTMPNVAHLITQDEIEQLLLRQERRYTLLYSGQQLRDRCICLPELILEIRPAGKDSG